MVLRVLLVACLFGAALSRDFPDITTLSFYSTEVQLTLAKEEATIYVNEYYDSVKSRGSVTIFMQGALQSVYYDNDTNEVLDVNSTYCKASEVDISDYTYTPLYHGWLNRDPLIMGPSAPLYYALKNKNKLKEAGTEKIRDIPCDKWELKILDKIDDLTIWYYFPPEDWTTPYMYKKFTPIRIRIFGKSARYTADMKVSVDVDQIQDFAYFKPTIEDLNVLQPPIGIGCQLRDKTDRMPSIPDTFKFSAEMIDLLQIDKHDDIEIQYERVWFDYPERLARVDRYTKKTGFKSAMYDFRGGAAYYRLNDGSCQMSTLRDTELVMYDLGMSGRMMTPKEYLMLDGNFYEMGKREIRGIRCDAFESVLFNVYFFGEAFYKFVVTAYFIESFTKVGVEGEMETQIPAYIIVNGWSSPTEKSLSMQYNIFGFDDVAWPPMYSSFGLEKCYTKPETKTYFVVVMEVGSKDAAKMEDNDQLIIMELRSTLAKHAKVPEHRIPFLKADYKSTGVFVAGTLLDRPPALLQFYAFPKSPENSVTRDPDLKTVGDADTLEGCAYACIDEGDFPCKGFYFCNRACFLKSVDPFEDEEGEKETDLGVCDEYIRTVRDSTTYEQDYLDTALENMETAILNQTIKVEFQIPNGEEIVTVRDIVVGEGPYTGVDAGDKPFKLVIEWRKLDADLTTTRSAFYTSTLTDCYNYCKEAVGECSSFSFCPDSTKDDKECLITSELVVKGVTSDGDLIADKNCNVYSPRYLDFYEEYPGKISLLPGDMSIRAVTSAESCAEKCRKEKSIVCRGFEYCRSRKTCTLHKKHILDLKPGETGSSKAECSHYAARYSADYKDMGPTLVEDESNIRYALTLDECAKICSEELGASCKSFNYCPQVDYTDSSCSLSEKLLGNDGVTTTEKKYCRHYEKRDVVHDWDKVKSKQFSTSGYTKKGFTGLVIGMLALGLILGAVGFVLYSYLRSKSSGEGMAVRFMKNDA